MGGGGPQDTTQEQKLPEWALPYIEGDVMDQFRNSPFLQNTYSQLGGPQMEMSNRTGLYNMGARNLAEMASRSNPYARTSRGLFGSGAAGAHTGLSGQMAEARGAFLGGNPYMSGALDRARGDIQTGFQEAVGQLGSQFAGAGNRGSSGNVAAFGQAAQEQLADPLKEMYAQAYMQNYEQERGRMSQAARDLAGTTQGLLGSGEGLQNLEFMNDQALMELGLSQQQMNDLNAERRFKNNMAGFEWDANRINRMVGPLSQLIRGYGTQVTSGPSAFQQNPVGSIGQGLGGAGGAMSGIAALKAL